MTTRIPDTYEPHRRRRSGFTLVELLITISIISLLLSLVVVAGSKMRQNTHLSNTNSLLQKLLTISTEYQVVMQGEIVNPDDPQWSEAKAVNVLGASGTGVIDDSIEKWVWAMWQVEETNAFIRALGRDALQDRDNDGFYEVIDPWYLEANDNKIAYEAIIHPLFTSAGPSRDFDATDDNLTSDDDQE